MGPFPRMSVRPPGGMGFDHHIAWARPGPSRMFRVRELLHGSARVLPYQAELARSAQHKPDRKPMNTASIGTGEHRLDPSF